MSKINMDEWVIVDKSEQAAGKPSVPRNQDPSMFHVIAWDVGYERGSWATAVQEETVEEEVEEEVVEEEEEKEEEDLSERAWLTEAEDAFDNIYGFGKDITGKSEESVPEGDTLAERIADELVNEAIKSAISEEEEAKANEANLTETATAEPPAEPSKEPSAEPSKEPSAEPAKKKVTIKTAQKTPTTKKTSKPRAGLTSPFLEKRKKSIMMKAKLANTIKAQACKEPTLLFSRTFPDTKFWKKFRKPVFHSYGRNNTRPTFGGSVWGGYMLSFNIGPVRGE